MIEDGFYWLTSERRSIGQMINGRWFLIDEDGPITTLTLQERGWDIGDYIGSDGA